MPKPNPENTAVPVLLTGTIDLSQILPIESDSIINTPYGSTYAYYSNEVWVIPRHGKDGETLPHHINHAANLAAAKQVGTFALGLGSVGSLDSDVAPGMLGVPDDIFSPYIIDTICTEENRIHSIPEFDMTLRRVVVSELQFHGFECIDGGVYAQTRGPRFETRAEIQWLSDYAHYVGMTCASELSIASELQMPYALLVCIDNWGNGIGPVPLSMDEFMAGVAHNHRHISAAVSAILPALKIYAQELANLRKR